MVPSESSRRLQGRRAFTETFRKGIRVPGPSMTLIFHLQPARPFRAGIVVTGRIRPHARRNLLKRRLRELVRRHQALLPPAGGALVLLYRGDPTRSFAVLHRDYLRTLRTLRRCCPA